METSGKKGRKLANIEVTSSGLEISCYIQGRESGEEKGGVVPAEQAGVRRASS